MSDAKKSHRSPKEVLLAFANENPSDVIVAVVVNGQIKCEVAFVNVGNVLMLKHCVDKYTTQAAEMVMFPPAVL